MELFRAIRIPHPLPKRNPHHLVWIFFLPEIRGGIRTHQMQQSGGLLPDSGSTVSTPRLNRIPHPDTQHHPKGWSFLLSEIRIGIQTHLNARLRGSLARSRLDGIDTTIESNPSSLMRYAIRKDGFFIGRNKDGDSNPSKCGADERRRRRLDGAVH